MTFPQDLARFAPIDTEPIIVLHQVLVGVSEKPVPHKEVTTSVTENLVIGGGNTKCQLKEVHVWLVHVQVLVESGLIVVTGKYFGG